MSTATIDFYNILLELGVDEAKAKNASEIFITKTEAIETLASKTDIHNLEKLILEGRNDSKSQIITLIMWMAGLLVAQGAAIVALQNLIG